VQRAPVDIACDDGDEEMEQDAEDNASRPALSESASPPFEGVFHSAMSILLSEFNFSAIALMLLVFVAVPQIVHHDGGEQMASANGESRNFLRNIHCQTHVVQYRGQPSPPDHEQEHEAANEGTRGRWNVGIRTTTFDYDTNTVYQCQHEIRIDDLFHCDHPGSDGESRALFGHGTRVVHLEVPRLFVPLGTGWSGIQSPPMMRIFKETASANGRLFARNHGVTALVMSLVGIAAFTAANSGLEELL